MLTIFLEASLTFQLQHTSDSPAVPVAHNIGAIHPDVTMVTGVIQGHSVDVPCDLRRRSPAELTREPDLRLVDVYDLGRLRGRSYPDWGFCGRNATVRTCFQAKPLEIANPRALDAPLTSVHIFSLRCTFEVIYTTKGDAHARARACVCVCVCLQNWINFCPYGLNSTPIST